jgi:hypothetical protein
MIGFVVLLLLVGLTAGAIVYIFMQLKNTYNKKHGFKSIGRYIKK